MNIADAKRNLFADGFLLGGFHRKQALKYLFELGNSESIKILIDAVDREHKNKDAIIRHLSSLSESDAVRTVVESWGQHRQPWLMNVAIGKALTHGMGAELPLDEETGMMVAGLASRPEMAEQASAYGQRVLSDWPPFALRFTLKVGWVSRLEPHPRLANSAIGLLSDEDSSIQKGARDYIDSLPNRPDLNSVLVDAWIRTGSEHLGKLVKEPRLPSEPDKVALVQLMRGDVAGYHQLNDTGGRHLAGALSMATPEMRRRINSVILDAKDAVLAEAYRLAVATGAEGADSKQAIQSLIAAGNEDGLVEATRTMTLADVLPLCKHWAETGRRPTNPKYAAIVERAVKAQQTTTDLEVEPAAALPEGLEDLFDYWQRESPTDLNADDPFERAGALFVGWQKGTVNEEELKQKATSEDWPERLIARLTGYGGDQPQDHVSWINTVAGLDADLLASPIQCGPEEMQTSEDLRARLSKTKGVVALRNWTLCETLCAFRSLYGGQIVVGEDDSADRPNAVQLGDEQVAADDLDF